MKKLSNVAEIIFFISLFGYLYLVAIKQVVGTPFTPVHDGVLLAIAVLVGVIWFILPTPSTKKKKLETTVEPTLFGLIGLQIIIILQAGSQNLQSIEFILTILGVSIFTVGSIHFLTTKELKKLTQHIPQKVQDKVSTDSFHLYSKAFAMFGLGLLTIFPWGYWLLTQAGLPVHPMTALIGAAVILVMLGLIKQLKLQKSSINLKKIKTLGDLIPQPVKLGVHVLSVIVVGGMISGIAYYAYAFQKPPEEMVTQGATLSLTDTSAGWTILDGSVFSTEAAFFPDQFLKFTIEVQESGVYRPTFLAEVSDLGGQVQFEVENLGEGIEASGELLPFQCSFWIDEEIFEVFLKDNGCPEFPREIELTPVELEAGETYQLTIEVTDQFPTAFNEQFQVEFGGYVQIQDFELRRQ